MRNPLSSSGLRTSIILLTTVFVVGWSRASAEPIFLVSFNDPGNVHSSFYGVIASHVRAAGVGWANHLSATGSVDVVVGFSPAIATATGRSLTTTVVATDRGRNVLEQGAASKLRTGIDSNGPVPDIEVTLGTDYLANELWFDPNPAARTGGVPGNKTDALSVFLHEFGHALGFNGWRDPATGALPGGFQSSFDALTVFDGTDFFFVGPSAMALYGGAVPLTYGNIFHVGNQFPRPGFDLNRDLMNGAGLSRGFRYGISALDVAILSDTGGFTPALLAQPLEPIPEPTGLVLITIGAAGLIARRRIRGRVGAPAAVPPHTVE